jgi:hypothetical protein
VAGLVAGGRNTYFQQVNPLFGIISSNFLSSLIDFFAVTDAKHDNIVALHVEDHAIITDAETVTAEFRVGQPFCVLERIVFEAKEGRTDTLFDTGIKPVNVFNGSLGIYQPVIQCPNTSSCVLTRPAL